MNELLLAGVFALGAGTIIGLFGAGGSIMMVPILTYGLKVPLKVAIGMTLMIEAVTGFVASWNHGRKGNTQIKAAVPFALAGMAGSFMGGYATKFIPTGLLMTIFAITVLAAAAMLIRNLVKGRIEAEGATPHVALFAAVGLGVGMLTGMVGVGGGFLIVPALVLLGGLDIKKAVGTSLFIIGLKSVAGVAGFLAGGTRFAPLLTAMIIVLNVAGSFIGEHLSTRLPIKKMQVGFVGLLLVLGTATMVKSLT